MTATLRLAFLGDLMIGRHVEASLRHRKPESCWGDILPELQSADLVVGNLECAVTTSNQRWPSPKTWRFRASPRALDILLAGNVGAVNLANNHLGDFCAAGVLDTLESLKAVGITAFGAGRTAAEAAQAVAVKRRDWTLGLIGFSDRMPEFAATETRPGTHFAWPPKGAAEAARVTKSWQGQPYDLRVLSAHWGPDLMARPTATRRGFAKALIAEGADIIHGHSSHILHGVEIIAGRPVFYDNGNSLEDFWPYPWPWTKRSSLFVLEIGATGSLLRQIPTVTHAMTLRRAPEPLAGRMRRRFQRHSEELGHRQQIVDGELVSTLALKLPSRAPHSP